MLAITLAEEVVWISRHNSGTCTISIQVFMPIKLLMSDCYRLCANESGNEEGFRIQLSFEYRKQPAVSFSATTGLVSFPDQYGTHTKVWE